MNLGIDLMGSDCSPLELFQATLSICRDYGQETSLTLYVDKVAFDAIITQHPIESHPKQISFCVVEEVVKMTDDPLTALKKENCPQVLGMKALAEKSQQAFISAGSTGALNVCAKRFLPMKPGVSRPFLMVMLPVGEKHVILCDVGANMSCKADHLVQYADAAIEFQRQHFSNTPPKIALLNVGTESNKGTLEHRIAYQKLAERSLIEDSPKRYTFAGNIEGRNIFDGQADIVITDGFTGNVLLKTMEGTAEYVLDRLISLLGDSELSKQLQKERSRFHYTEFCGAVLAGVDGLVIKCHGDASEISMYNGIKGAIELLRSQSSDY